MVTGFSATLPAKDYNVLLANNYSGYLRNLWSSSETIRVMHTKMIIAQSFDRMCHFYGFLCDFSRFPVLISLFLRDEDGVIPLIFL